MKSASAACGMRRDAPIFTDVGACTPPNPPRPNLPAYAVDTRTLHMATEALVAINEGLIMDEHELVYEAGKCRPYEGSRIALKY